MNGIHTWQFVLASALTFATLHAICAVAVVLFPDGALVF
jgi:ABC-type Na+ efflux pump permease subunit